MCESREVWTVDHRGFGARVEVVMGVRTEPGARDTREVRAMPLGRVV